jgi:O-antigen/teichoic acid export membrane protein
MIIGYYNIAFTLTLALSYMITSGFSGVILVAFSEFVKQKSWKEIANGWISFLKISIFFCVPLFFFFIWNSRSIIILFYSDLYLDVVPLFQIFASLFLLSILLGSGANSTILYSLHHEKVVLYLRTIFGSLNIVLDIVLIPKYEAVGALVATGVSTIFIILSEYVFLNKKVKISYPFGFLAKIMLATGFSLFFLSIYSILNLSNLFLFTITYLGVFILSIYKLKPFNNDDQKIVKKISDRAEKIILPFTKTLKYS